MGRKGHVVRFLTRLFPEKHTDGTLHKKTQKKRANASCLWMKKNPDVIEAWSIEIKRNDFLIVHYPDIAVTFGTILLLAQMFILICSVVWLNIHQKFRSVRSLSVHFSQLFTVGLIILDIGAIAGLYHVNAVTCNMEVIV